ncbi:hypothetical protein QYE76_069823 [Lolium multiflorum]|uniref:Integrase catalytic domain-containing protein n=1 Tax=Lolium multiflorum TaxID=4521 RepID=A0AAD8SIS5_LOLMU|nr:hypothetical protein QYE76_069823 [Lolium multiflorum]
MNPIIKPWPFRGWGMDMIGKIHPASSKGHEWILAITDYFTKWVEAVPMKKVKSEDVIKFVKEHVIHRFGIPQTITTDGGSVFISKEFRKFCDDMGIKLIRSSPYYAQANGQAEASNQSLIKLIKRKIDENPRVWHETLSEALWAYRMSCHGAIKTSPYQLVYGQEAVLPWEITAGSRRVTFQNDLTAEEYAALMSDTIEDATELRLWSLEKIKENKARVARAYNKKVRPKEFQVGDLVWEAVLPLGTKDKAYGKWSPNWHGPYKVVQALKGNAYMLEQLDGAKFPVAVLVYGPLLPFAAVGRSPSAPLPAGSSHRLRGRPPVRGLYHSLPSTLPRRRCPTRRGTAAGGNPGSRWLPSSSSSSSEKVYPSVRTSHPRFRFQPAGEEPELFVRRSRTCRLGPNGGGVVLSVPPFSGRAPRSASSEQLTGPVHRALACGNEEHRRISTSRRRTKKRRTGEERSYEAGGGRVRSHCSGLGILGADSQNRVRMKRRIVRALLNKGI